MNAAICLEHRGRAAPVYCRGCHRPLCRLCRRDFDPFCSATCRDAAAEGLARGLSPHEKEALARMSAEVAAMTAMAEAPPDRKGQPGRFRLRTKTAFVALLICVGAQVQVLRSGCPGEWRDVVKAIVVFPAVAALWFFVDDLRTPAVRGRATPRAAAVCFFQAVRFSNWRAAWACLSPWARGQSPEPLASPAELKAYWRDVAIGSDFVLTGVRVGDFEESGSIARQIVTLELTSIVTSDQFKSILLNRYDRWFFGRRYRTEREELQLDVVLVKIRSQWWVLTGRDGSLFDRYLEVPSG